MKKTLQLKGLDCAACAGELEEEIAATAGRSRSSSIRRTTSRKWQW